MRAILLSYASYLIAEAAPHVVRANSPATAAPWVRATIALAMPAGLIIGGIIFAWRESRRS